MSITILLLCGALIGLWMLLEFFTGKSVKKILVTIKEYPIDKRNRQKEIDLLNNLLQDIKDNTYAWTYTGYNYSSMASMSIINDVKNIAILLDETMLLRTATTIFVHFGMKDIAKYKQNNDNISIRIRGEHVTKFCIQIEEALDSRGHELDLFKEQINNKL